MADSTWKNTGQRLRTACDRCQASKVRCSRVKPSCWRCSQSCVPCVYGPLRRTGRPPKRGSDSAATSNVTDRDSTTTSGPAPNGGGNSRPTATTRTQNETAASGPSALGGSAWQPSQQEQQQPQSRERRVPRQVDQQRPEQGKQHEQGQQQQQQQQQRRQQKQQNQQQCASENGGLFAAQQSSTLGGAMDAVVQNTRTQWEPSLSPRQGGINTSPDDIIMDFDAANFSVDPNAHEPDAAHGSGTLVDGPMDVEANNDHTPLSRAYNNLGFDGWDWALVGDNNAVPSTSFLDFDDMVTTDLGLYQAPSVSVDGTRDATHMLPPADILGNTSMVRLSPSPASGPSGPATSWGRPPPSASTSVFASTSAASTSALHFGAQSTPLTGNSIAGTTASGDGIPQPCGGACYKALSELLVELNESDSKVEGQCAVSLDTLLNLDRKMQRATRRAFDCQHCMEKGSNQTLIMLMYMSLDYLLQLFEKQYQQQQQDQQQQDQQQRDQEPPPPPAPATAPAHGQPQLGKRVGLCKKSLAYEQSPSRVRMATAAVAAVTARRASMLGAAREKQAPIPPPPAAVPIVDSCSPGSGSSRRPYPWTDAPLLVGGFAVEDAVKAGFLRRLLLEYIENSLTILAELEIESGVILHGIDRSIATEKSLDIYRRAFFFRGRLRLSG